MMIKVTGLLKDSTKNDKTLQKITNKFEDEHRVAVRMTVTGAFIYALILDGSIVLNIIPTPITPLANVMD